MGFESAEKMRCRRRASVGHTGAHALPWPTANATAAADSQVTTPDVEAATRFLVARFQADPTSVSPLAAGAWSAPFAFRAAGRDLVARFSPLDGDFRKDAAAARFASAALPVPPVVEIGEAFGGFFAITERRSGTYLEVATAPEARRLVPGVLAMLDAIRNADVWATTGYGSWGVDEVGAYATWREALLAIGVDRPSLRIHGWSEAIRRWPQAAAAFREAMAALELIADDTTASRNLIHSDLLHGNVLVAGEAVTAVLDWGSALYGDFLFDLAWLWFWGRWSPAWADLDWLAEATRHYASIGLDVPDFVRRVRACALYIGLDGMTYQAWTGRGSDLAWTADRTMTVLRET